LVQGWPLIVAANEMLPPKKTSVVILITLAELAWLAALGLLFAYKGKDGELRKVRSDYTSVSNHLARWEAGSPDTAKLLTQLDEQRERAKSAEFQLKAIKTLLNGKSASEVGALLEEVEARRERLANWETERRELTSQLALKTEAHSNMLAEVKSSFELITKLKNQMSEMVETNALLAKTALSLQNERQKVQADNSRLVERVGQLEIGEVAIRRELTGLPTNDLHRVIFVVDTSSSMYNSPAWKAARDLMRSWVEYLSVQECVLISFNDQLEVFPKTGYYRIRDSAGNIMPNKQSDLVTAFDRSKPGVFSDLLKALRLAYSYERPDLIVLFTDGQPHVATSTDSHYANAIVKEAGIARIPILTVAVGSYELEGAGGPREHANEAITFLKQLAAKTGGSFIAR
jgi:Mg-chelatase subunit ChlD